MKVNLLHSNRILDGVYIYIFWLFLNLQCGESNGTLIVQFWKVMKGLLKLWIFLYKTDVVSK